MNTETAKDVAYSLTRLIKHSYYTHFCKQIHISYKLLIGSFYFCVNAIIPYVYQNTCYNYITKLHHLQAHERIECISNNSYLTHDDIIQSHHR